MKVFSGRMSDASPVPSASHSSVSDTKMEQSHALVLNEQAYRQCPDPHKAMFLHEWLRYLDRILPLTKKTDLKDCQPKLLEQLVSRISAGCATPTRVLLGRCIARVFAIAENYDLFHTINTCNDALKDPAGQSHVKLTALCVLGEMYEKLGRMVGRSYEETFQALSKWMKSAESSARSEILLTMAKMVEGLGAGAFQVYKELYKGLAKALTDRVMLVRAAAAKCLACLVAVPDSPLFTQHDLDSVCTLCIKALHCASAEVRRAVARVFAKIAARVVAESSRKGGPSTSGTAGGSSTFTTFVGAKPIGTLPDVLQCLASGMQKGGVGGFLKTAKTATGIQPGGQRETRVGIAEAYVAIADELGTRWLKRNIGLWCTHLLEVAAKCADLEAKHSGPSTTASNAGLGRQNDPSGGSDGAALCVRRCVHFVLRSTFGQLLSEPDLIIACKQLGNALAELINCFDCAMDSSREEERVIGSEVQASAHACIVCLMEIGSIALQVDTAITSIFVEASGILEPVFGCLLHPVESVRVAAAWALKCVVSAVPSLSTPLVDRCLSRLEYLKKSPEALSGFSLALAALLSARSPLGIPFAKARQVFAVAEEMIKQATQTPRLMLRKVRAGWLLVTAVISMGPAFTKPALSSLFTLWRMSFPRSVEECKTERGCGDAITWEATLEARAGALASMGALVECGGAELCTAEVTRRMTVPVETALGTMGMVGDLLLLHGVRIRPAIQLLHLRLFSLLEHLPVGRFESAVNPLLKELVAELTLSDNAQATQCTSLCASTCTSLKAQFLEGAWADAQYLEAQLNPAETVPAGAPDNDPVQALIVRGGDGHHEGTTDGWWWPEPASLPITALNSAVRLFARVFPAISARCKLQLMQHFAHQLAQTKPGPRLRALQLNIACALCMAARAIGERRAGRLEDEQLRQVTTQLMLPLVGSGDLLLKCLAVECLGRIAQAVDTPQFVAAIAQLCFDKIRLQKDECSRQGFALSLGVLHRYMGSLGSGQHLNTAISILLALAQDTNCSSIRPWALFSLSLIASTGGGMFYPYAEPVRNLCLQLLLHNAPQLAPEVVHSVAKLLFALIGAAGPELNASGMDTARQELLVGASMLLNFEQDPLVQADALACLQHLHLFAPRHVELHHLVLTLCELLQSPLLLLRKQALACLRQLLQHEARECREHAKTLAPPAGIRHHAERARARLPETGLEGALFALLDMEQDTEARQHARQCLHFLLQAGAEQRLAFWLSLCREVLAGGSGSGGGMQDNAQLLRSTMCVQVGVAGEHDTANGRGEHAGQENTSTNDDDTLHADSAMDEHRQTRGARVAPRWHTRVFAFDIVQRLLALCDSARAHLDLALAKELLQGSQQRIAIAEEEEDDEEQQQDYLVLHLAELIKMGFMGASAENTQLRMAGLNCLQSIITKFARVAEPEFPGHVLLEQYQAQISAALRPAFAPDTPGTVTALACQVTSTWICSGVARELNDLRKIHQLLASSMSKLSGAPTSNALLYNESSCTLERLAILKAWAKVYICATEQQDGGLLLGLVEPELDTLRDCWHAALRDWALLTLPVQYATQLAEAGGAFFTSDSVQICKDHYRAAWPLLLLACSVWTRQREAEERDRTNPNALRTRGPARTRRLYLMLGISLESLCNTQHYSMDDRPAQLCLRAMQQLLGCEWVQAELMRDVRMPIEMLNVLYKVALTRDSMQTQRLCKELASALMDAAHHALRAETRKIELDAQNGNDQAVADKSASDTDAEEDDAEDCWEGRPNGHMAPERPFRGGEGAEGVFDPRYSLVFATLELCMCVLTRQIPQLSGGKAKSRLLSMTPLHSARKGGRLSAESTDLIHSVVVLLPRLQPLCCTEGQLVVVPSLLNILFGVIRDVSSAQQPASITPTPSVSTSKVANGSISALRQVCSVCPDPVLERELFGAWESLMRSALLSLLNMAEDCQSDDAEKSCTLLLAAVALFLAAVTASPASASISSAASTFPRPPRMCIDEAQFQQLCRLLRFALHACNIRAMQAARALFNCASVSAPFVRELGNDCFAAIRPFVENEKEQPNEAQLPMIRETVLAIEAILGCAHGERERIFVSLLVRSLAQFLQPADSRVALQPQHLRELHDFALGRLNAIGAQHQQSFKALLDAAPAVRARIEAAVERQQAARRKHSQQQQLGMGQSAQQPQQQQTIIKLATDFSAFASASATTAPDKEAEKADLDGQDA